MQTIMRAIGMNINIYYITARASMGENIGKLVGRKLVAIEEPSIVTEVSMRFFPLFYHASGFHEG